LSDLLGGRPLPISQVVQYGIGIANALREIHELNCVYGCLHPANIVLRNAGVELMQAEPSNLLSHYSAPEHLLGNYTDPRSDIFTLGSILYEMASGLSAFERRSSEDMRAAILECPPAPLNDAPVRLVRIVGTCLEKRPERRFQRVQLVAAQLKLLAASLRESSPVAESRATSSNGHAPVPPVVEMEPCPVEQGPIQSVIMEPAEPEPIAVAHEVVSQEEVETTGRANKRMPCPKCKSTDVRQSRPKDSWEDALAKSGIKFCRCHRCYHRFMHLAFLTVSLNG
jgi:serine/threonine protein kinase